MTTRADYERIVEVMMQAYCRFCASGPPRRDRIDGAYGPQERCSEWREIL